MTEQNHFKRLQKMFKEQVELKTNSTSSNTTTTKRNQFDVFDVFTKTLSKIENVQARDYLLKKLNSLRQQELNILIVGATGVGKSSTVNALFEMDNAKIGQGSSPETQEITSYKIENVTIWDTPGLGDSTANDARFGRMIAHKLLEQDGNGKALIDLVLCLIDGSSRDLGTTYSILKEHIFPNLGDNPGQRIVLAINKADQAMSGRNWDSVENKPNAKLESFLNDKVSTTASRIYEDTGVEILPIYYSAGYKEDDEEQKPYNISKLLHYIIHKTSKKKRAAVLRDVSSNENNFKYDDRKQDYNEETKQTASNSLWESIKDGAEKLVDTFLPKGVATAVKTVGKILGSLFGW